MAILSVVVCFIAYITLSNGACNLLESGNGAYIDTESESALTTMCSGDLSALTLWEQYQCEYMENRLGYQQCWPQRRMSECAPGELKGVVFFYHGYSACPNQYNPLAPKLTAECYHVYQILSLGHGYNYCDDPNVDGCVDGRYNLTYLPTVRAPYIEYVTRMLGVIEDEVSIIKECESAADTAFEVQTDLEVVVGGLSFGAPLTAATVALSGADSIFTKQIFMSPFFGVSYGGLDDLIYKCVLNTNSFRDCLPMYFKAIGVGSNDDEVSDENANALSDAVLDALAYYVDVDVLDTSYETLNLLVRKTLEWIVENPEGISDVDTRNTVNGFVDNVMSWGRQCELDILNQDRGGFCNFTIRNLLGSASFAQFVIENVTDGQAVDTSIDTLLVMVERDGPTRNSLVADYVNRFYDYQEDVIYEKVNDCMWFISSECQSNDYQGDIDNNCGVPHSSMSDADNLGKSPGWLWWNETYHQGLIDWINDASTYDGKFLRKSNWDGSRAQCVYLDPIDPPAALVADVPRLLKLGFNIIGSNVAAALREQILDEIASITGVARGVIELSFGVIRNGRLNLDPNADSEGDYYEFSVALDSDGEDLMTVLLQNDAVTSIANVSLEYAEVGGVVYEITENTPTTTTDESSGDRVIMMYTSMICGVIIFKSFFM